MKKNVRLLFEFLSRRLAVQKIMVNHISSSFERREEWEWEGRNGNATSGDKNGELLQTHHQTVLDTDGRVGVGETAALRC